MRLQPRGRELYEGRVQGGAGIDHAAGRQGPEIRRRGFQDIAFRGRGLRGRGVPDPARGHRRKEYPRERVGVGQGSGGERGGRTQARGRGGARPDRAGAKIISGVRVQVPDRGREARGRRGGDRESEGGARRRFQDIRGALIVVGVPPLGRRRGEEGGGERRRGESRRERSEKDLLSRVIVEVVPGERPARLAQHPAQTRIASLHPHVIGRGSADGAPGSVEHQPIEGRLRGQIPQSDIGVGPSRDAHEIEDRGGDAHSPVPGELYPARVHVGHGTILRAEGSGIDEGVVGAPRVEPVDDGGEAGNAFQRHPSVRRHAQLRAAPAECRIGTAEEQALAFAMVPGGGDQREIHPVPLLRRPSAGEIHSELRVGRGHVKAAHAPGKSPHRGARGRPIHAPRPGAIFDGDELADRLSVIEGHDRGRMAGAAHELGRGGRGSIELDRLLQGPSASRQSVVSPEPHRSGIVVLMIGEQMAAQRVEPRRRNAHRGLDAGILHPQRFHPRARELHPRGLIGPRRPGRVEAYGSVHEGIGG